MGGKDTLNGAGGNDRLDGGTGSDSMRGGDGDDTYVVDNSGDVVKESADMGYDVVESSVSYTLGANVEYLTLTGSAAINATGNALDNSLSGNDAANVLNGGAGSDDMSGGGGDDTYIVDSYSDRLMENPGGGIDTVYSGISLDLSRGQSEIENVTLTGTAENASGNDRANALVGNAGNNSLGGYGGNDVLSGMAGNDSLWGGSGNDTLIGGLGDDEYQFALGYGEDRIENAASDFATATDKLWFIHAVPGDVQLTRENDDLVVALSATDRVVIAGYFSEAGNGKIDRIVFGGNQTEWDQATIEAHVESPAEPSAGPDRLDGSAAANEIHGAAGNGTLYSDGGDDKLYGENDGDLLNGGAGSDLVLKMGTADQLTFKNWYAATPSKPVVNLQVIAEAMAGFDAGGADPLLDQQVENFNFSGLVGAFDAACTASPTLTRWALTHALLDFQLAGSDSAAIGGDLAYQYGKNGTLAGIGLTAAQEVIGSASFGTQAQTLRSLESLQTGNVRLS